MESDETQTRESVQLAPEKVPAWLIASVAVGIVAVLVLSGLVVNLAMKRDLLAARARDARLEVFERGAAERPDDPNARLQLAFSYQQNELNREAIAEYKKVLSADPTNLVALYNTGVIQLRTGKDAAGEQSLSRVLELSPRHALATYDLATHYAETGDFERAASIAVPAADAHPGNADLQYVAGLALEGTDRAKEAVARYRAALRLVPDLPEAKSALQRLGSAQ